MNLIPHLAGSSLLKTLSKLRNCRIKFIAQTELYHYTVKDFEVLAKTVNCSAVSF